ncbi:Lcl C-terminal domain-containing protein [Photobacterium swingsii]|uniref:Lcl C-terminal domain-containing protein n=1 Tax=Photobacterium swingsii TaxID=680026 RepID=UPI0040675F6B
MKKTIASTLISTFFALITSNAAATSTQECDINLPKSAPNVRFQDNKDGTVTDLRTDLVWQRCTLGQTWNKTNNECEGKADKMYWQAALQRAEIINNDKSDPLHHFGNRQEWRLPNIKELQSIRESSCVKPALNKRYFPMSINYMLEESDAWSSTASHSDNHIFKMGIGTGQISTYGPTTVKLRVLLVSDK